MAAKSKPKIVVVLGPTASGKSDLAVSLAHRFNGEVISADSRQVYKGLDIGTGKITKREMKGVPHYLLDVVSPKKQFSVSQFKKMAEETVQTILGKNKLPIICGGTAHYISALLGEQQIPEVPPDPELRKNLEKKSVEKLFEMLKKKDSRRAAEIDPKNKRRLVRALEIIEKLGKVPSHSASPDSRASRDKKHDFLKIGIQISNELLRARIEKRIDKWFKQGLLEEVKSLHNPPAGGGLSWKRMSEIGLEYGLVAEHLSRTRLDRQKSLNFQQPKVSRTGLDTSGLKELKKKMAKKTWQYAKRQMLWWKRDKKIIWIDPKIEKVKKEVGKFLKN